jgi:O-antigen ligase
MNSFSLDRSADTFWRDNLLAAAAAGFVLPIPLSNMLLAMVIVANILTGSLHEFNRRITQPVYIWPTLFFLWCVLSVAWSDNATEGWHYAERKLTLMLLPLSFAFVTSVSQEALHKVAKVYVWSVTLSLLYCWQRAWVMYRYTGDEDYFYYHGLSGFIGLNAVYFSAYIVLSMMFVWHYRKKIYPGFVLAYLFLHFTGLLMLASKLVLLLAVAILLGLFIPVLKNGRKYLYAVLFFLAGAVGLFFAAGDYTRERFAEESSSSMKVVMQDTFSYNTPFTGTTLRLVLWKHALKIVQQEKAWLCGVGTGDFQQLLNKRYAESGMFMGDSRRGDSGYKGYNPHNQYIEVFIATGITGFIFFLAWILSLWKAAHVRPILRQMVLLVSMVMFTESYLSANKGIVWFAFWAYLFISSSSQTVKEENI